MGVKDKRRMTSLQSDEKNEKRKDEFLSVMPQSD